MTQYSASLLSKKINFAYYNVNNVSLITKKILILGVIKFKVVLKMEVYQRNLIDFITIRMFQLFKVPSYELNAYPLYNLDCDTRHCIHSNTTR